MDTAPIESHEEKKAFYKKIFVLVLPMALQNLINVGVQAADVLMLGNVGETVLSASSLAGQLQFILNIVFFGISSGSVVLAAQYWGKGRTDIIEQILGIALKISFVFGFLFFCLGFFFPATVMRIFTNDEAVILEGIKYLRILSLSFLPISVTMIYLNILRSVERVMISTLVYSVSLVVNIILNAFLIFGLGPFPRLGITGAAYATLIARFVELGIIFLYNGLAKLPIHIKLKNILQANRELFRDFIKYSTPVVCNEALWSIGFSMISVIIGHLDTSLVAANSVSQVLRQLASVIIFGLSNATAILVGSAIGQNKKEMAFLYAKRCVRLCAAIGAVTAVALVLIFPLFLPLSSLSEAANRYLHLMIYLIGLYIILQSVSITLIIGVFRAGGDTKMALLLDVLFLWLGSVLFGALSAFVFRLDPMWVYAVLMIDEVLKAPFVLFRFRSRKWLQNITREF